MPPFDPRTLTTETLKKHLDECDAKDTALNQERLALIHRQTQLTQERKYDEVDRLLSKYKTIHLHVTRNTTKAYKITKELIRRQIQEMRAGLNI